MSEAMTSHEPVLYPESDGEPMGETDLHRRETVALLDMLEWHFRDEPSVYVAGDNFLYYEEGNPRAQVSPDVYVVRGAGKELRRIYQLWQEDGRVPCFVMEVSSRSTWLEDHGNKKALYAKLGVDEYFLFDPEGDSIAPPLQGHRLNESGEYERIVENDDGSLSVETLRLRFSLDDDLSLVVQDALNGQRLVRSQEARSQVKQALEQAERATRMAEQAARMAEQATRERDELAARVAALEARLDEG